MDPHKTLTRPTRCDQCREPMESPIACSSCGAFTQLSPDTFDCFELFGLKRSYDIDLDALHHKFLAMSRVIHPDISSHDSDERRQQALSLSAEFNRAYETLYDPVTRAEYLLSLSGGPNSSEDKAVSGNLLGEVLMIREELDEAIAARDTGALDTLKQQITAKYDQALGVIAELAGSLDQASQKDRKKLREQLNTIKYWKNLLNQIPTGMAG